MHNTAPVALGWSVTTTPQDEHSATHESPAVELAPGITAPRTITASGPYKAVPADPQEEEGPSNEINAPVQVRAVMKYDERSECFLLRSLEVAAPDGEEVTSAALRDIASLRIMRWVIPTTISIDQAQASPYAAAFITGAAPDRDDPAIGKPAAEDAAQIYKLAVAVRKRPRKAAADTLGIHIRTVTNWLAKAHAEEQELRDLAESDLEDLFETQDTDRWPV